jgi:hypothetical protein
VGPRDDVAQLREVLEFCREIGSEPERVRVGEVELWLRAAVPPSAAATATEDPHLPDRDQERREFEEITYGASEGDLPPYDAETFAALHRAVG